jgi:transposase
MSTAKKHSADFRKATVRQVFEERGGREPQRKAIVSIAARIVGTTETPRDGVRQAGRDSRRGTALTADERERLTALERDNRELRQANEILRRVSALFARKELDRRLT